MDSAQTGQLRARRAAVRARALPYMDKFLVPVANEVEAACARGLVTRILNHFGWRESEGAVGNDTVGGALGAGGGPAARPMLHRRGMLEADALSGDETSQQSTPHVAMDTMPTIGDHQRTLLIRSPGHRLRKTVVAREVYYLLSTKHRWGPKVILPRQRWASSRVSALADCAEKVAWVENLVQPRKGEALLPRTSAIWPAELSDKFIFGALAAPEDKLSLELAAARKIYLTAEQRPRTIYLGKLAAAARRTIYLWSSACSA
ncbi:hypothetical protein CYMTET_33220 [Cymbomonas tetramitiformis]|uniref:Uncharacterized protein n=1 Tax=Cymbomonas tetramitiformis TaxID=36881 RepID=A0AAE0KRF1_9CHLO|nr:hypothetical protein CYMTET_33220 [Cymbomonas tetramitiformis]